MNYKTNRLRLAKVIVKNKMSRFLWFTVYISFVLLGLELRLSSIGQYDCCEFNVADLANSQWRVQQQAN